MSRWCDQSIHDPGTLRQTQWPLTRSRVCLELGSRKPSWPAFMCERTYRPDIWTQRSEQSTAKYLARRGPSTYGSGSRNPSGPAVIAPRRQGRTHDRNRPTRQISHLFSCIQEAVHTCTNAMNSGSAKTNIVDLLLIIISHSEIPQGGR